MHASEYELDEAAIAKLWQQGSVVRSWLLELLGLAFDADPGLTGIRGYVDDSGEGRWTVEESIRTAVPAPVIALSLMMRQRSRQDDSYARQGQRRPPPAVRRPRGAEGVSTNPLRDGMRMSRVPGPGALVIFGASGDLSHRKLLPALYNLALRNMLPSDVRADRRGPPRLWRRRGLPQGGAQGARGLLAHAADRRRRLRDVRARDLLRQRLVRRSQDVRRAEAPACAGRSRARHAGQRRLLPRDPADRLPARHDEARRGGHGAQPHLDALGRAGEAVRPRRRFRARARRRRALVLPREPGLPHRPLPRQGDGPEHPGAAFRERHLRARLEPQLHRPRADHRLGVDRRRGPRPLLRGGGSGARHHAEPPPAGALVRRHGAARIVRRRIRAQRARQGARHAALARHRRRRARPVRRGLRGRQRGAGLS